MASQYSDSLIRSSPYAWWEWDVTADRVEFNDLKATMLGYEPDQFRGGGYRAFTELVHPEDLEKTMDAMVRVLEGSAALYQVDYRIRSQTGDYRWYLDRGTVLGRGASGRPTFLRGIVVDLGLEGRTSGTIEAVLTLLTASVRHYALTERSSVVLCSCCHRAKVRADEWVVVTPNLLSLVGQEVSHGLCPRCVRELYPEWADRILGTPPSSQTP